MKLQLLGSHDEFRQKLIQKVPSKKILEIPSSLIIKKDNEYFLVKDRGISVGLIVDIKIEDYNHILISEIVKNNWEETEKNIVKVFAEKGNDKVILHMDM